MGGESNQCNKTGCHKMNLKHCSKLITPLPLTQCSAANRLTCQAGPPSTLGWSPAQWVDGPPGGTPACHPGPSHPCLLSPPWPGAHWLRSRPGGGMQLSWPWPWVGDQRWARHPGQHCFVCTAWQTVPRRLNFRKQVGWYILIFTFLKSRGNNAKGEKMYPLHAAF